MKKMLPYLTIIIFAFYLLPIIIQDTSSAMSVLLLFIPIICFVTSIIYGIKNSFNIVFIVIVAFLFIPSIFIFYNYTALTYTFIFGLISLVGNAIGSIFYKKSA